MRWFLKRVLLIVCVLVFVGVPLSGLGVYLTLRASLARQGGAVVDGSLAGAVEISRDGRGVPVIRASSGSFEDAAFGQGFVHAQERFFQMDGLRRAAAGEIAALIGSAGVEMDKKVRPYRWRSIAPKIVANLPERHRKWIDAYTRGVNAGLADLGARPPEYVALLSAPEPWLVEDSVLCAMAMHDNLTFGHQFEWRREALRAAFDEPAAEFFMPASSRWDTPIDGPAGDPAGGRAVPGAEVVSRARDAAKRAEEDRQERTEATPPRGSNNWAVAGSRTADGRAILANDMHLGLMVPPTWFHVQLEWGGRRAAGVSLPGVPGIVAGSNGDVAWGFTNATADLEDWVIIEVDPKDAGRYLVPEGGSEAFGSVTEVVRVRFGQPLTLTYQSTRWGLVTRRDSVGRPMVLKWPALDPATVNIGILDAINARTLEEAESAARSWWGPPQNVAIASRDGRVALVVSGWIPQREGFDGRYPVSWASGAARWAGPIDESTRPAIVDPPGGAVWSANSRAFSVEKASVLGGEWSLGERARRIAELLARPGAPGERDMLAMQLDTRVELMDFYRDVILKLVPENESDVILKRARDAVAGWNGNAEVDQAGFAVLDRFHRALRRRLVASVADLSRTVVGDFGYFSFADDEPLRRVVEERPGHWLSAPYTSWDEMLRASLTAAANAVWTKERPSADWGTLNTVRVRHPLAMAVPQLGRWLNYRAMPLPGHPSAVRVQGVAFGASERLVVSPGHEKDGILTLPGGQSGHFMSAHYQDGFAAWATGEAAPLLAGDAVSRFTITPK